MTGLAKTATDWVPPDPRGRLVRHAPLKKLCWFRVGGAADWLFQPADLDDLRAFLAATPAHIPVNILGGGSNTLVRDGGIAGVVVHLVAGFADIRCEGNIATAGAGAMDIHVSRQAADAGIAGLEFLVGIPGTVGGAVAMNAGAYGRDVGDCLVDCQILTRGGACETLDAAALGFAYRHTELPHGAIILSARFRGRAGDPADIRADMRRITNERSETQPIGTRTGGSTFKNPPQGRAWEAIDRAGCRGLWQGGAQVSSKHCNFLINHGDATADDIETLGETVRRRVRRVCGLDLEWELKRLGRASGGGDR